LKICLQMQKPKPELEELLKARSEAESANFRGPWIVTSFGVLFWRLSRLFHWWDRQPSAGSNFYDVHFNVNQQLLRSALKRESGLKRETEQRPTLPGLLYSWVEQALP